MRHLRIALTVFVLVAATGAPSPSRAQQAESVVVTNFPEVQEVTGRVTISEPIPQTRFEALKAVVPPVSPAEASQWTEAGILDTRGFTHVTLSLAGTLQGSSQTGSIGVALVPDVAELLNALRTHGVAPFALRADAETGATPGGFFSSASTTLRLGFPRYRVYLYNSTSKSAEALVYAYLSGS